MSANAEADGLRTIETKIPARMDRLPWARWHWMVVLGLGLVWILDGLEVTIVGSIASRLTEKGSGIELSEFQIGQAAAIYVAGACLGALFFARLTDKFGRKKLFMVTLGVYLVATTATAFSGSYLFFVACRFFTGAGIGGEYAAINSAIDELIPARVRGTVDLIINGSFWLGTAFGAALSVVALNTDLFAKDFGWRLAFGLGAVLGILIMLVRRTVPESPRWLMIHGRDREADEIVGDIEHQVADSTGDRLPEPKGDPIRIAQTGSTSFREIGRTMFKDYRQRSWVGFSLFVGQAFLYNAVFFTYGTVLTTFYGIDSGSVPWYIVPFAIGNFAGPLILGRLYDVVGRRPMIAGSYILSGLLLLITAFLFKADVLNATTQTICWCVIFFFASAGASSAYLTVSEIFPMETRAMAIAFFYAIGTAVGGITGPLLFGKLIGTGHETPVFWGFALGAILMIIGGVVQAIWGVAAEQRSLEDVAKPLTAQDAEPSRNGDRGDDAGGDGDARDDGAPDRGGTGRFSRERVPAMAGSGGGGRGGSRRLGSYQAQTMWSPSQQVSIRSAEDTDVEAEIDTLVAVLTEQGPLGRRELAAGAGSRSWGPGRFGRALRLALLEGLVHRQGRDRFAAGPRPE
jgi:MFS family permease